jgi:hypothetical protein
MVVKPAKLLQGFGVVWIFLKDTFVCILCRVKLVFAFTLDKYKHLRLKKLHLSAAHRHGRFESIHLPGQEDAVDY